MKDGGDAKAQRRCRNKGGGMTRVDDVDEGGGVMRVGGVDGRGGPMRVDGVDEGDDAKRGIRVDGG